MKTEMIFYSEQDARKYKASKERGPYQVWIQRSKKYYDPVRGCVSVKFKAVIKPK